MSKVIVTKSKLDTLNDAISTKSGTATNRTIDEMVTAVAAIPTGGGSLTPLTNPAAASDIVSGKEAYSDQSVKITGSYVPLDTSDATASASDIANGKTAYVNGSKLTGTLDPNRIDTDIGSFGGFGVIKTTVTIGSNSVTTGVQFREYIAGLIDGAHEARIIAATIHDKQSYVNNEVLQTAFNRGYSNSYWIRRWISSSSSASTPMQAGNSCVAVAGSVYDVFYYVQTSAS